MEALDSSKRKINVTDSFHFDDQRYGDLFEREPFIVRFAARNAPVQDFFVVSIHTTPAKAEQEIGHLVKAYDDASRRFNIQVWLLHMQYACPSQPRTL